MLRYVTQFFPWFDANISASIGASTPRSASTGSQTRSARDRNFAYQSLEPRQLLAGISFNAGIVSIIGSEANDTSLVSETSPTEITVALSGFAAQTFTASAVTQLYFSGLGGDDYFSNQTDIVSHVNGGDGNDRLLGGSGNDLLVGKAGNDFIIGGAGDDVLIGSEGDDVLRGDAGDDVLSGNDGIDRLLGFGGDDTLFAGAGNDILLGGIGDDDLRGGDGDDAIYGDEGDDFANGGVGEDFIAGGTGVDTLFGGAHNDILRGDDGFDRLEGNHGDDHLVGGQGDDVLFGGLGTDSLFGNGGNDFLDGNEGPDSIFGGPGNDQITGSDGSDRLFGNAGNDTINGGFGLDLIVGDLGDDILNGGNHLDIIYGNAGNDTIRGGFSPDTISGGDGDDQIFGDQGNDTVFGNAGNDILHGGVGNDQLNGNDGDDRIYGELGIDILRGQGGNDSLIGGVTPGDTLNSGPGKDRMLFFDGDIMIAVQPADARIEFRNASNSWTNAEVAVIDDGFDLMQQRTSNTRLLKGTVTDEPLVFIKEFVLPPSGRLGANTLATVTEEILNPNTGLPETITKQEHQIQFGDWDETDSGLNALHLAEVTREVAHNWASNASIAAVLPSQASAFESFKTISGWTTTRPTENVLSFYDVSLDNRWFFFKSALFTEGYAKTNPVEDFSATWKYYFDPSIPGNEKGTFVTKINRLEDLFTRLEIL